VKKKPRGKSFQRIEIPGLTPAALAKAARESFSLEGAAGTFGTSKSTLLRRMGETDQAGAPTAEAHALSLAWYGELGRKHDALRAAVWETALGTQAFEKMMGRKVPIKGKDLVKPNPVSQIWLTKNELGWSDKNLLESKFQGDPKKIPEEELMSLVKRALEKIGRPGEAALLEAMTKKVESDNGGESAESSLA
jgi:hypothetical protein